MNQVLRNAEEELAIEMIEGMKQMDISSDEFHSAMESFVEIRKAINDSEKIEVDRDVKADQIEFDQKKFEEENRLSLRRIEMEETRNREDICVAKNLNKTDAIVKGIGVGATLAAELIKLGAFGRFYHQGMEYERTDSYSTLSTKSLAQSVSKMLRF